MGLAQPPNMFIYTREEQMGKTAAQKSHRRVRASDLRVCHAASSMLEAPEFLDLVPSPPQRGRIGVAGEYVVEGVMDFLEALKSRKTLIVSNDLDENEDPAVIEMYGARDLLPDAKDGLAAGVAYTQVKRAIALLPRFDERNHREGHRRQYGLTRGKRRKEMWAVVFGCSESELRRYATALEAPPAVRKLFRSGHMTLAQVLEVVAADDIIAAAVERDLQAGDALDEVLARHLPRVEHVRPVRVAIGTLLKGLRRGLVELNGRVQETKLTHSDIETVWASKELINEILAHAGEDLAGGNLTA